MMGHVRIKDWNQKLGLLRLQYVSYSFA